ncbi:hypothetical protein ACIBP6_21375 [Nonomuraea terrae]|uniref:hypothetical protein n=1 Tax=Nonomuraea terrae TaxID=2530383 RepID=UPI0037A887CF
MRPPSVILTFLGDHVYGRDICVSSRTFIDAFARVGISEEATRSALTRMVRRGLLRRTRAGRRMHFGLTPASTEVLRDGERRIWHSGVVNDADEDRWTLIGFSLPESWQRQRHELRSRLVWAGFAGYRGASARRAGRRRRPSSRPGSLRRAAVRRWLWASGGGR